MCNELERLIADNTVVTFDELNTLRPRQNGRHFADDTFKRILGNENARISIKIPLKFVAKGPINNIPALVQIMAWRRPGDKPLSEPMLVFVPTHICVTRPHWVNVPIELTTINNAIKQLKCGKGGGDDQLLNELFSSGWDILSPYFVSLFNFIFDVGIFSDGWGGEGLIVPLHYKGFVLNPTNYRAITLLSVLGKLFTMILSNRLDGWAEKHQTYIEAKNGFRRGRGTPDSVFISL